MQHLQESEKYDDFITELTSLRRLWEGILLLAILDIKNPDPRKPYIYRRAKRWMCVMEPAFLEVCERADRNPVSVLKCIDGL